MAPEEIIPLLAQYNLIGQLLRETIIDEAIASPLTSTLITILVLGARYFAYLQPFELQAYDRFMSQRPAIERSDERLLLVTIDESDIRYQNRRLLKGRGSLSDQALAKLLQKLEVYKPQVDK